MSRWDALKPESRTKRTFTGLGDTRAAEGLLSPRTSSRCKTNNRKESAKSLSNLSCESKPQTLGCESKPRKLDEIISFLNEKNDSNNQQPPTVKWQRIADLADVIIQDRSFSNLTVLNLSENVLDGVFLPFLRDFLLFDWGAVQETAQQLQTALQILTALERMVGNPNRNSPHVSKLLSPFVVEVSASGKEKQKPNHIRLELLDILQRILQRSHSAPLLLTQKVASCMLHTLQAARFFEGTTKHAMGEKLDVEPTILYQYFLDNSDLTNEERPNSNKSASFSLSLELLMALVQRHPETSPQLMSLLLLRQQFNQPSQVTANTYQQTTTPNLSCDSCGLCFQETPSFFRVLHYSRTYTRRQQSLAVLLIVEILDRVSCTVLEQWLCEPKIRSCTSSNNTISFGDRVRATIQTLVETCQCNLHQNLDNDNVPNALLAGTILRRLPYDKIVDKILMDSGITLATVLLERFLELNPSAGGGRESFLFLLQQSMAEGLIKAIGGSETPQGIFLGMSLPMKKILNTVQGHIFLQKLLQKSARDGQVLRNVLRALVLTHPVPFLSNENLWNSFMTFVFGVMDLVKLQSCVGSEVGIQTLAALLEGRMNVVNGGSDDNFLISSNRLAKVVLPQLQNTLSPATPANLKVPALSAYGSLLPHDWDALVKKSVAVSHLNPIICLCQDSTCNSKVRKVAFKALGDVSTNYFSCQGAKEHVNLYENKSICKSICEAILRELERENESVVSMMALYSLGNVARIVKEFHGNMLDHMNLEHFTVRLLEICNPKRDKISSDPKMQINAIRALGHLVCLIFSERGKIALNEEEKVNWIGNLTRVLDTLDFSVRQMVCLGKGEIQENLSWKERSAVKKIGLAACHALSLLLPLVHESRELDERARESTRQCLLSLMDCVFNLSCLHEKVGHVAMSVLCSINPSSSRLRPSWKHERPIVLGPIVMKCIGFIRGGAGDEAALSEDSSPLPARTIGQVEVLFLHLLSCCSVSDAESVLTSSIWANMDEGLHFLHNWLLAQKLSNKDGMAVQRAFDTFALALQKRPDLLVTVDVQLEQQFANQARYALPLYSRNDANTQYDVEDEEEL